MLVSAAAGHMLSYNMPYTDEAEDDLTLTKLNDLNVQINEENAGEKSKDSDAVIQSIDLTSTSSEIDAKAQAFVDSDDNLNAELEQ